MIEQATAFATTPRDDTAYKSWQSSMSKAVMRHDPESRTAGPVPTFGTMVHETAMAAQGLNNAYAPPSAPSSDGKTPDLAYETKAKDDEYTFNDVLDVINPLQHLPVIGNIYRKISGDTIKGMSAIIGGALFGGPIGAVATTANVIVRDRTGKDLADNALSLMGFGSAGEPVKNNDIVYTTRKENDQPQMAAANLYARTSAGTSRNFAANQNIGQTIIHTSGFSFNA